MNDDPDPAGPRAAGADRIRDGGYVACLIGVLSMVSGRFMTGAPSWLIYAGLSVIVLGWGFLALSMFRRAALARANASEAKS